MKQFLLVVAFIAVGIFGVGFYRGWFSVNKEKIQEDKKAATENIQDAEHNIAARVEGTNKSTMDGTVVSVTSDKLTMTGKDGKEHSHALTATTKVTCDGKPCTVADLKAGTQIRVTADRHSASRIEAIDKEAAFASKHDGSAVTINGDTLVMKPTDGKGEETYTIASGVKVTCDGKLCKASDIKPGMKVRVTTEGAEPKTATQIEALDKNRAFDEGILSRELYIAPGH